AESTDPPPGELAVGFFIVRNQERRRKKAMSEASGSNGDGSGQLPGIVVLKFGGTSVEDSHAVRRLVRIVRSRLNFGVVVVVSALAMVTDQLLRIGRLAEEGNRGAAEAELDELQLRHEQVASELLPEDSYANVHKEFDDGGGAIRVLLCDIESNR